MMQPTVGLPHPGSLRWPLWSNSLMSKSSSSVKLKACASEYPLASKILVKNLSYSTGKNILQKEFSQFGEIAEVKIIKDETTKRSKGYAFIQYTCQDDAMSALDTMDYKVESKHALCTRVISVELVKLRRNSFGRIITSGPPKEKHQQAENKPEE